MLERFNTQQFITEAKTNSLNKICDIYSPELYFHGTARFGPVSTYTPEDEDFFLINTPKDPNMDRLRSSFKYGIVSRSFTNRIRVPYSSNFGDHDSYGKISLTRGENDPLLWAASYGIIGATRFDANVKISVEDVFVFIVSKSLKTEPLDGDEFRRKLRVRQKDFEGIVFLDGENTPAGQIPGRSSVDFNSASHEEIIDTITTEMLDVYRDRPELAIPIYGISGDLYWPKRVSYEEIKQGRIN